MFALLAASLFACQDPPPAKPPVPVEAAKAAIEVWDDKTAKAKVKAFDRLWKKQAGMGARKRALDELVGGSNRYLIKPLQRVVETDKSVVIKRQAVAMIAAQPADDANDTIRKLLKNAKVTSDPQVHAGLIAALAQNGYDGKTWREIEHVFESDYDTERIPVHEAMLELVTKHKEKQALPMLLRNLDEPIPGNVDAADNPPAEYWKARWTSWAAWRGKVKQALFAITGQNFSTAAEAKAWLDKNPLK